MNEHVKKQLAKLERKELRMVQKRTRLSRTTSNPIKQKLPSPKGLSTTLETAFYKGFQLVFEKGIRILEKTYDKQQLQLDHELMELGYQKMPSRRNLSCIRRKAEKSTHLNSLTTVVEGTLLGVLGIGLPDIPIFIGMLLKSIYEIALGYGFLYDTPEERFYILKLLETALSRPQDFLKLNAQTDAAAYDLNAGKPLSFDLDLQTQATAHALASEMLTMKFVQGLPIIGMVGGVCNFACHKKIMDYVQIKYQKRYLLKKLL